MEPNQVLPMSSPYSHRMSNLCDLATEESIPESTNGVFRV